MYTKIQFLVVRGTRSCIRLHVMGVLATVYDTPISRLLKEQYRHAIHRWKAQNPSFTMRRGTRSCIRVHGSGVLGNQGSLKARGLSRMLCDADVTF